MLHLPAKDAGQFGRNVLDVLFTKEELRGHLIYASKKSVKPGLDGGKVALLMGKYIYIYIYRRYIILLYILYNI